ncbi:uncharacterized protein LOC129647319 [Bubalus kerabau]|uniref:uncharacterized protein LOC129647319 n=1 Tax=Bubalus carabanensis TaxID=3119969 RepID=UPI00244EED3B|nr:uncharacterized protein LOC129647319 [Bubalus carabanensis]
MEPDILEWEIKWALVSISTNKASGGDGIPDELFRILRDDAVKVLHVICQQIWKNQQWPRDWKRSNPTYKEQWLRGRSKAKRSYSTFKVRGGSCEEIALVQGKEQQLHSAGAAVKRYPMSKSLYPGLGRGRWKEPSQRKSRSINRTLILLRAETEEIEEEEQMEKKTLEEEFHYAIQGKEKHWKRFQLSLLEMAMSTQNTWHVDTSSDDEKAREDC